MFKIKYRHKTVLIQALYQLSKHFKNFGNNTLVISFLIEVFSENFQKAFSQKCTLCGKQEVGLTVFYIHNNFVHLFGFLLFLLETTLLIFLHQTTKLLIFKSFIK